jgi:hypothetical protein
VVYRTTTGVVWREPWCGWYYSILEHARPADAPSWHYTRHGHFATSEEAERALRKHLAQWHLNVSKDDRAADVITNVQDQREHLEYYNLVAAQAEEIARLAKERHGL